MSDARRVHEPVMVDEVLALLTPPEGSTVLDLTVGAGGHAEALLGATANGALVGLDRDPQVLAIAERTLARFGDRVRLVRSGFDRVAAVCAGLGIEKVGGALLDLGVSSLQLDDPGRGFSFDRDGPLDMRMDPDGERTAADLVNRGNRDELFHAIGVLGEEPRARRVVDEILAARRVAPLRRTCELADLVARVAPSSPKRHHPATRTFLGLRMAVNDEAGAIERCLPQVVGLLEKGAVAAVIAFHGGEDRIVKQCFRTAQRAGSVEAVTTRPLTPSGAEVSRNPRARSARIRAVRRTDMAVGAGGEEFEVHAGGGGPG